MSGKLANETRQARERRRAREDQQRLEGDLRAVMSMPQGRRFVWWLIDAVGGTFSPSYAEDGLNTAYNEGRRAVGIGLMTEVQRVVPESYLTMLREAVELQVKRDKAEDEDEEPTVE